MNLPRCLLPFLLSSTRSCRHWSRRSSPTLVMCIKCKVSPCNTYNLQGELRYLHDSITENDIHNEVNQSLIDATTHEISQRLNRNLTSEIRDVLVYLLDCNVSKIQIVESFCASPVLLTHSKARWVKWIEAFTLNGIHPSDATVIITSRGGLLASDTGSVGKAIDNLRSLGFKEDSLCTFAQRFPDVFFMAPKAVSSRVYQLKFVFTKDDILRMCCTCPNILHEDWEKLEYKIHYILFKMGIEQKQIVKSRVLSYPISHIRLRHEFLKRSGGFKKPDPKLKNVVYNPHLSEIMDSSDENFAETLSKLTVEELHIFADLIKLEEDDEEE